MIQFSLFLLFHHGVCGRVLRNDPQEQCTPVDSGLLSLEGGGEFELNENRQ